MARADINQNQTFAYVASEYQNLQYYADSKWNIVPGIEGSSLDGSSTPTRDIVGANSASQQRIGRPRVGTISFEANALPQDPAWRALRDYHNSGELVRWRYETNNEATFQADASDGAKVDIEATGVMSFLPGDNSGQAAPTLDSDAGLGRGAVVKVGSASYIITEVDKTSGAFTVAQLPNYTTSGMTAQDEVTPFTIYNPPGLRWEFRAYVVQSADFSLGAESHMTTSLVLAPKHRINDPVLVTT